MNQCVHQDDLHGTYIKLGVHLKRRWMEDDIHNPVWPFRICCDAICLYQHACYLSTFNEQCILWVFGWFCGLLHQWHLHFLKEHGRPWVPCTSSFGKVIEMAFAWILVRFKPLLIGHSSFYSRCPMLSWIC
jgi:hypothetical protein